MQWQITNMEERELQSSEGGPSYFKMKFKIRALFSYVQVFALQLYGI